MHRLTITLLALVYFSSTAIADDSEPKTNVAHYGGVRPASSLMSWRIDRNGQAFGVVDGVFIDIAAESVAFLLVRVTDSDGARYFALPPAAVAAKERSGQLQDWVTDRMLEQARTVKKGKPIELTWAIDEYKTYQRTYPVVQNRNSNDSELLELAKLKKRPVTDTAGKKVGAVIDYGINVAKSKVTYAVLRPTSKQLALNAIPLSNLVESNKVWRINLPAEEIYSVRKFEPWRWPQ